MDLERLQSRSEIIKSIRAFFDERSYLEVDTPLMAPDLIPESCLEVFQTEYLPPGTTRENWKEKAQERWLIPSPEIWLKKLIAKYSADGRECPSLYEICHCFRNVESQGYQHSPEFTMLEYYTMDADYLDSLSITEALLQSLTVKFPRAASFFPIEKIPMQEAFARWAGGVPYDDVTFIDRVEPNLPKDHAVVLIDYPVSVPCLAKKNTDGRSYQRWEMYINGVELCNCYSEEDDPEEIRQFFRKEAKEKQKNALVRHKIDENYWKIFHTFPKCSGVAMGLDRLAMALLGCKTIEGVLIT
ncbi:MAG: LysR family transcriptional regulator [Spirochaetaceae bacterium]|jgi:lysyl-tRNA synthetase class 2|nr:LysR family transcriptional regulator [Spirochaetaceae bacterium]